jgi:hypothetical protein
MLNFQGGSPSERVYKDLVEKTETGFFEKYRSFEMLKRNLFVKQAYNKR